MSPLGQAALAYAARGIPVFPVHGVDRGRCTCGHDAAWHEDKRHKPGKHPATEHGLKDATLDPAIVELWWRRRPMLNIGLRPGPESGFWVLDEDGPAGDASMAALEREHGALPTTPTQVTGRGRHRLFAWPKDYDLRNSAGRIGLGVDVRGAGGYIVVAPSNHELGVPYAWAPGLGLLDVPISPAPDWLLDLTRPKSRAPIAAGPARPRQVIDGRASPYGEAAITNACRRIVTAAAGQRNNALWLNAISLGQLVAGGEIRERGYAWDALVSAGQAMCNATGAPWTKKELDTLERGFALGETEPRRAPERQGRQLARQDAGPTPVQREATPAETVQTAQTAREIWDSARPAGCWAVFEWMKARQMAPEGIPGALSRLRVHGRAPFADGLAPALVAPLRTAPGGPVNGVGLLRLDGQSERFGRLIGETERRAVTLTAFEDPAQPLLVAIDLQDAWALGAAAWRQGQRLDVAIAPTLSAFAGAPLGDRFGRITPDVPCADPERAPWTVDRQGDVIAAVRGDLKSPRMRARKPAAGGTYEVWLYGPAAAAFYGGLIRQAWSAHANGVRLLAPAAGQVGFHPVTKREAA